MFILKKEFHKLRTINISYSGIFLIKEEKVKNILPTLGGSQDSLFFWSKDKWRKKSKKKVGVFIIDTR